jgi:drug/metabolite transporter (DMT)-like permease
VFAKKSNGAIALALLLTIVLWGASNAGTSFLVEKWPAGWVGATRFLTAGFISLAILRRTSWLGPMTPLTAADERGLWLRGGLTLAVYIMAFNLAMHYTAAAHVALYLGTAPVWTLLWEERPTWTARSARRYGAAALALSGVVVLFWPSLWSGTANWIGELLGLAASVLWAVFGFQGRALGAKLSGAEVSAHAMWRAGLLLLPVALVETLQLSAGRKAGFVLFHGGFWRSDLVLVQLYCAVGGGVLAYALFYNALRHWPTTQVYLFNNLIPVSTMIWSHFCLGEEVTRTFWLAMALIVCGVALGHDRWEKVLGAKWLPME